MNKILTYLQQQEKLTMFVGVLLGLVFVANVELQWGRNVTVIHAQSDEGVESIISEVVDLEENETELVDDEEVIVPAVSNSLIEEDLVEIETQVNGVNGGVTIETTPIINDEPVDEEILVAMGQTDKPVEVLDANAVPNDEEGCKSWNFTYMAYTKVTNQNSDQYQFLYNDDLCYSDPLTGIRMSQGRYCIAVGSFYTTKIGQKIDLVLTNGEVIKCILGDCKSDEHTDPTHRFHAVDGSVAEFIVDYDYFSSSSQWESLNLTTIREIQLVADEDDDISQIESEIAAHKAAVEQQQAAEALAEETSEDTEIPEGMSAEEFEQLQEQAAQMQAEQANEDNEETTPNEVQNG